MALNAYVKTPWLDKIVDETTGETIQDGTLITAARLGNLENGVSAVTGEVIAQTTQLTTTNIGNVYKVTVDPAPDSYTDGMLLRVKINAGSTGAASFQINDLAAKPVYDSLGNVVSNLKANTPYQLCYESTADRFIVLGKGGGGTAQPADVASGKTFCNDNGQQTGTSTKVYGPGDTITDDNLVASIVGGSVAWQNAQNQTNQFSWDCDDTYAYYSTGGNINVVKISDGTAVRTLAASPVSSAAIAHDQDTVYAGDSGGNIYAFSKSTGTQIWKVNIGASYYAAAILPLSDSIIVNSSGKVVRLSKSNGNAVWSVTQYITAKCTDSTYIYGYNGQGVEAIKISDGSVAWSKTVAYSITDIAVDDSVYAVFWTSSSQNGMEVSKFDKSGNLIWTSAAIYVLTMVLALDAQYVYVAGSSGQGAVALSKTDGSQVWVNNSLNAQSGLFCAHNSIYMSGYAVIGTQNSKSIFGVMRINSVDGSRIWFRENYDPTTNAKIKYSNPDIVIAFCFYTSAWWFFLGKIYAESKYTING